MFDRHRKDLPHTDESQPSAWRNQQATNLGATPRDGTNSFVYAVRKLGQRCFANYQRRSGLAAEYQFALVANTLSGGTRRLRKRRSYHREILS
jgi:hypothetical protein